MLKGHVCIDLHNHKTGLKDRIEGDNAIVDGLKYNINMYINTLAYASFQPLATRCLNGLALIDKPLDTDSIFLPGDATVVGCGNQGSNTTSDYCGTYNTLESGWSDDQLTYTHVWDFATSQANGTINAVALLNRDSAYTRCMPFVFTGYNRGFSSSNVIYPLFFDLDNNDFYFCKDRTANSVVYKYRFNPLVMTLHDNVYNTESNMRTYAVATEVTIDNTGIPWVYGYDGHIYKPTTSTNTLSLKKVKISDLSFDVIETLTYTFPGSIFTTTSNNSYYIAVNMEAERVYVYSNDRKTIYMVNTDTNAVTPVDVTDYYISSTSNICWIMQPNGMLHVEYTQSSGTWKGYAVLTTGAISNTYTVLSSSVSYVDGSRVIAGLGAYRQMFYVLENGIMITPNIQSTGFYFAGNMLCTNYNLSQEIEKTNALSMKVTYTLTQA